MLFALQTSQIGTWKPLVQMKDKLNRFVMQPFNCQNLVYIFYIFISLMLKMSANKIEQLIGVEILQSIDNFNSIIRRIIWPIL